MGCATGLILSTFCLDRALHYGLHSLRVLHSLSKNFRELEATRSKPYALKSKNTTQMLIEVNLLIRDRNVRDPAATDSGTFAVSWSATYAQPSWSAYLHFTACSSQCSDLLRVWRYNIASDGVDGWNDPRSTVTAPAVTVFYAHHCLQQLLQKQTSFGWRILIPPRPRREYSRFQIHIRFLYPNRIRQTTNISLKTRLPRPRARRLCGSFSIILLKVSCSFPFLKSLIVI